MPLFKKKEKSKKKEAAHSLSDMSKTNTSSVSLSITQVDYVSKPSADQVEQMRVDKKKEQAEERRNDLIENALSGTTVVLGLVNQAAQFSQVPGLSNAAQLALGLLKIIQGVKDSNRQYNLLVKDATDFIASIWRSYQQSRHPDTWSSPDMMDVISELVVTLNDITVFVRERLSRKMLTKILSSNADPSQVLEYRERIKSAVKKFELASHLKLNEMLQQVYRDQLQIAAHLAQNGIDTLSPAALLLHAIGKSQSGFDIETSSNASLATSSQSTSAATSPRASDQPSAFIIEEQPQSTRIAVTQTDTPPPAGGSAPNNPQLSSPSMAYSPPPTSEPLSPSSPTLSSPSSLPTSPSFTEVSISSAISADSGTVASSTLVGSPEAEHTAPASTVTHWPSSNFDNNNNRNDSDNSNSQREDDQHSDDHHDINILVDDTHAPPADPGPDNVRMGKRMPTSAGNAILKGDITISPAGTASESESRGTSDTETAVSEGSDLMSAASRAMAKERQFLDRERDDDDEERYEQRPQSKPPKQSGRAPPRTDTEVTLTSEDRRDTLKSPPLRRQSRQTTIDEDEEMQRCDSPVPEQPRRRHQESKEFLQSKKRQASVQEEYEAPSRSTRGSAGRPAPQRGDTARSGSRRGTQEYDDQQEEQAPRRGSGKGKAPQMNYRAQVHDVSDEENEDFEQEDISEDGSQDNGNSHLDQYVAGVRRNAAAAVSGRTSSAAAAGSSARKTAAKNVGKDEKLSIKFSKIELSAKKKQQQQQLEEEEEEAEEEEEEEEEEEYTPAPSKKRRSTRPTRPTRPPQRDTYDPYGGHHNAYAPDPYYGSYPGPYHGYHQPAPPPPPHAYYSPPPQPRYGPAALGFMPGFPYGGGTSSTVTMSNVGNDNSVHITTNRSKKSKRREG